MSRLVDMRTVIEYFEALKQTARLYAANHDNSYRGLELHDIAMAYAAAVRKVARKDRGQ